MLLVHRIARCERFHHWPQARRELLERTPFAQQVRQRCRAARLVGYTLRMVAECSQEVEMLRALVRGPERCDERVGNAGRHVCV